MPKIKSKGKTLSPEDKIILGSSKMGEGLGLMLAGVFEGIAPAIQDLSDSIAGVFIGLGEIDFKSYFEQMERINKQIEVELERQRRLAPPDDSWWLDTPSLRERWEYQDKCMRQIRGWISFPVRWLYKQYKRMRESLETNNVSENPELG
jgi:hypothetical protein